MKVRLSADEAYPVYDLIPFETDHHFYKKSKNYIEVSEELYNRYVRINTEYEALQTELSKLEEE